MQCGAAMPVMHGANVLGAPSQSESASGEEPRREAIPGPFETVGDHIQESAKSAKAPDDGKPDRKKGSRRRRLIVTLFAVGSVLLVGGLGLGLRTSPSGLSITLPLLAPAATTSPLANAATKGAKGIVYLRQGDTSGSGVYFGPGRVITAAHVVSGDSPISVRYAGSSAQAREVGGAAVESLDSIRDYPNSNQATTWW